MLPIVFKTGKSVEFSQLMKNYVVKNYDATCYSKPVQAFLGEFQQNRNVVISLNDIAKTYDALKSNKDILITYLNMLNIIKSKMNFGKDGDYAVKIEFSWKDILKNSNWSSYNISFEYYCNLFNLGVIYYLLGNVTNSESLDEDVKLKEAIKYYQYSAGIFDTIKNEAPGLIPVKETPYDLSPNYLTFCSYLCIAQGQSCLLKVAGKKATNLELQAQLAKGIYDLYNSAFLLTTDSLKKYAEDDLKAYLTNRKFFYAGTSFFKMKDLTMEEFENTGENFGKALVYQGYGVDSLNNGYKDIKKCKNFVDVTEYEAILKKETEIGEDMFEKNKRVFFSPTPELQSLPKLEKKVLVNPAIPPEYKTEIEGNSALDSLIPKEVKGMIEAYKQRMMVYISENLNNYENESTIAAFLCELNLPFSLEAILSQSEISESLWKKINDVQQKGGTMFLTNTITSLGKKSEDIEKSLNESMMLLKQEEDDDTKMRQLYGSRWSRVQSCLLTEQYTNVLADYAKKLGQARGCDEKTKTEIMENMKYFELLTLSKNSLNNKIPKKTDPSSIQNCNEAVALRKDLDTMDGYSNKCQELINKIFQLLNEDNIAPQFIKVLQNKTTENAVFAENKTKYEAMFTELQEISEAIKQLKLSIPEKNEAFLKVKQSSFQPNEENDKFFKDLETYAQQFQQKLIQLQQGMNFYNQFSQKLKELNTNITDYIMSRDLDKNELIRSLSSGTPYRGKSGVDNNPYKDTYWDLTQGQPKYMNPSAYLDPAQNPFTQMNVVGYRTTNQQTTQTQPTQQLNQQQTAQMYQGFQGISGYQAPYVQGYVNPNQGFVNPNQGFVNPNQGFVNMNIGYVNPNQGFVNPNQGFVNPKQATDKKK